MLETSIERRFRVALSFPGQKRSFVEKVANALASELGRDRVLYDKWFEGEFARPNLGTYLPNLYRREADLVVAFHGRDYQQQDWCGAEWTAIQTLIHNQRPDAVMLCRFDRDAEVPGIFETAGYIDIEDESDSRASEVATEILKRLPRPGVTIPEGEFVYVCEPSGDIEGEHVRLVNDLKSELGSLGLTVISPEFRKKPDLIESIPLLVSAASFVIQLHGPSPVQAPFDDFGASIEYWLISELRKLCTPPEDAEDSEPNKIPGATWLRWRSDALRPKHISDEFHRQVVFDEEGEVTALPNVKFKEFVVETVRLRREREKLPEIKNSQVLIRTTENDGPATGDLCDWVDTYENEEGDVPLTSHLVLQDVSLRTYCDAYRERSMRPGGLFVVYESALTKEPSIAHEWVSSAMQECRTVALAYRPTLPVCLVYAAKSDDEAAKLMSVPGRFRVVTYRPPDPDIKDDAGGPVEEEALKAALKKAEEVQR